MSLALHNNCVFCDVQCSWTITNETVQHVPGNLRENKLVLMHTHICIHVNTFNVSDFQKEIYKLTEISIQHTHICRYLTCLYIKKNQQPKTFTDCALHFNKSEPQLWTIHLSFDLSESQRNTGKCTCWLSVLRYVTYNTWHIKQ